jgi:hypothetical protein
MPTITENQKNGQLKLDDAVMFARNWLQKGAISAPDFRAFTVRLEELESLVRHMKGIGLNAARFYLGIKEDSPSKVVNDIPAVKPCLLMSGVRGFEVNFDVTPPLVEKVGEEVYFSGTEDIEGEFVYDFAYPCPDTCQLKDSPLMDPPPTGPLTKY